MKNPDSLHSMTFMEHLAELRTRLIWIGLSWMGATLICYHFSQEIFNFLARPLSTLLSPGHKLIYTNLTQGFLTHLRVALWSGLFLSFPFISRQIWLFVSPGLYEKEKRMGKIILFLSPFLFFLGAAMSYYLVFPIAWKFFLSFELQSPSSSVPIQLEASIDQYLSLVIQMIFAFGVSFQLPILLTLGCRLGMMSPVSLRRYRRHGIVGIFIIAAIVTPPDVMSQIALALPLMGLYELSLLLVWFLERPPQKKETHGA